MGKSLWIMLAVMAVTVSAPNAHADSLTISTAATPAVNPGPGLGFLSDTATLSGGNAPTGELTFELFGPSSLPVSGCDITETVTGDKAYSATCNLTLMSGAYTWDVTYSGDSNNPGIGPLQETVAAAAAAPEPSSVALMLLGVCLVFVMRKRIGQGLSQAS